MHLRVSQAEHDFSANVDKNNEQSEGQSSSHMAANLSSICVNRNCVMLEALVCQLCNESSELFGRA